MEDLLVINIDPYIQSKKLGENYTTFNIDSKQAKQLDKDFNFDDLPPTQIVFTSKYASNRFTYFYLNELYIRINRLIRRWGIEETRRVFQQGISNKNTRIINNLIGYKDIHVYYVQDLLQDFQPKNRIYSDLHRHVSNYIHKLEQKAAREQRKKEQQNRSVSWTESQPLFIPDIGVIIELTEDWVFTLSREYRNQSLFNTINDETGVIHNKQRRPLQQLGKMITFKAGTQLKCSRVYIRQNSANYSSITWTVVNPTTLIYNNKEYPIKKGRFFCKLRDANTIKCRIDLKSIPVYEM